MSMTFEQYRDQEGFPLTSTQEPTWRRCWDAAAQNAKDAMKVQDLFRLGMKREMGELLDAPADGITLNVGCGESKIAGAVNVDFPEWDAELYEIQLPRISIMPEHPVIANDRHPANLPFAQQLVRCPDNFLSVIHAYHFLEHLHDPRRMLREMQRCLKRGGLINIVVPHYSGSMSHQDLDHKHSFALDTWANTFNREFYSKGHDGWELKIQFNAMIAITERNAAIVTQLVKDPVPHASRESIIGQHGRK